MKSKGMIVKLLPLFVAAFFQWTYCMVYYPIGHVYAAFPGQDALVTTVMTLPGILAMVGGFIAAGFMTKIGRKNLIIASYILMLASGVLINLFGANNLWLTVICSGLTGIPAGTVASAIYATYGAITPPNLRDKVVGWSDTAVTIGTILPGFISGFLAADGVWTRAFAYYYVLIPAIIVMIIFLPNEKKIAEMEAENNVAMADAGNAVVEGVSYVPKGTYGLLIVKLFQGLFYLGLGLFLSNMIVNETSLGNIAIMSTADTVSQIIGVATLALMFIVLKAFKGWTNCIGMIICGAACALVSIWPSAAMIFVAFAIKSFGMNVHHVGMGTLMSMGPKGKALNTITSLFVSATFISEALGGYVVPWVSGIIFGSSLPSKCLLTCAIFCVVFGFVGLPFFSKMYKDVFPAKGKDETPAPAAEA